MARWPEDLRLRLRFTFQQNNGPKSTVRSTMGWFRPVLEGRCPATFKCDPISQMAELRPQQSNKFYRSRWVQFYSDKISGNTGSPWNTALVLGKDSCIKTLQGCIHSFEGNLCFSLL
ncbi:hypothetical protein AMECASPLE_032422 [Ameca splendens]|uniref:Uncharacterized protein n=1 Tax=Ameca splendens TaxID=208324 RepID=A0ABV0ZFD4_9TELE